MKKSNQKIQTKAPDDHLAVISVILGSLSLFNTIFTGIPAIVLGIMALRRKSGNQAQAKLGILFGSIGCLLLIPIIWLSVHFLRIPFDQQTSIPRQDSLQIQQIGKALNTFKRNTGAYPDCESGQTPETCDSWQQFLNANPGLVTYPVVFESDSFNIQSQPVGTLVYALNTDCFISVPVEPGSVNNQPPPRNLKDFAALIYFHPKGRACYSVNKL